MHTYTIIIFLPVTGWLSKIVTEFVLLGWKISPAAIDNIIVRVGTISGSIGLTVETDSSDFDSVVKVSAKVKEILNKNDISFFGIIAKSNSAMTWSPSNTEFKKETKTAYRD